MKFLTYLAVFLLLTNGPIFASSGEEQELLLISSVLRLQYPHELYIPRSLAPALQTYASACSPDEREQFVDPLVWYCPTPDELTFLSSLGFRNEHLGAILRFRKFITADNASLYQRVLAHTTWQESQNVMPAALGLSPEALEEAALIPAYKDRLAFLQNAPREDAWVYGMLGSDRAVDSVLEQHVKKRIEASPEYVSALFIRNLNEGSDITRMRLTGLLSQVTNLFDNTQRFQRLDYKTDSNVVRILEKRKCIPPFGLFLVRFEDENAFGHRRLSPSPGDSMPAWTYTPSAYLAPLM